MSLASDFGGVGVVHALGWTLLHFCWQGAVVAAVLWCVLALTEGCSARMRYGLACAALALMVVLPVGTLVRLAVEEHRLAEWMRQAPADLGQGTVVWAGAGDRAVPWTVRATVALDRAAAWLPVIWAVGLLFFLVRMRAGFAGARRMTSVGTGRVSAGLAEIFDRLRVRMGVMRPVRLLSSAAVEAPTVIGWLRPVVLVPVSCLTGLSEEQIGAILAHELAHVRRHDYLVNVAQTAVETLLFYHPCVWWVSRQVRRERECCCDDVAVSIGGDQVDRLAYARALATLEEFRAGMGEVSGMALGANGGVLTMRIRRVLGMRESGVGSRAVAALVLAVLVMVGGATAFSLAHAQQKTGQAGTAMRAEDATDAKLAVAAQGGAAASIAFSKGQGGVLSAEQQNALEDSKVFQGLSAERQQRVKERIAALDGLRPEDWKRIEQTKLALAEKLKSPEFKAQMEAARGLADTIGNPDFRKRVDEIVREGAKASGGASSRQPLEAKLSSLEFKKEMADALAAAEKVDTPEFRKQMQDSSRALQDLASPEMRGRLDKLMAKNAVAAPGGADDSPVVAPPPPTGPVRVSGGVMAGAIVTKVDPVYPPEAKAAGVQGAVVLKAIISKTGVIESLVVVSGPEPLQGSAVDAVKHWVYKPYLLNGEPQEVQTTITVNYTLEGLAPGPAASSGAGIDGGPVRVSSGVMASNLVYKPDPFIPASLDTSHVHGAVIVNALVSKTGTVESLQVVSGPKEILPAVLDALRQWRYKPYLLNGEPVQVQTTITMNLEFGGGVSGGEAGVAPKKIGNGVSAPILYSQVDPAYDDQARTEKAEGAVVVNLWVDTLGHPTHVRVLRGIGHGLDEKAVEAVKQYRFKPAMENGLPVMVELNVEVNFKII